MRALLVASLVMINPKQSYINLITKVIRHKEPYPAERDYFVLKLIQ